MGKWYNTTRFTDSDADELTFLIGLLFEPVNLYAAHHIRQWRDDNRFRLLCLRLRLPLRLRLRLRWCPGLSLCLSLFLSPSLEFQLKILAAEKGVKFLVPEFLLANSIIEIDAP